MTQEYQKRVWDAIKAQLKDQLCVTTLETKEYLRRTYPGEKFFQTDIAEVFRDFFDTGLISKAADNGTFCLYVRTGQLPYWELDEAIQEDTTTPSMDAKATDDTPTARPKPKTKRVGATRLANLLDEVGGSFFTVVFKKKNGDEREMNCKRIPGVNPTKRGMLTVMDRKDGGRHRIINIQTMTELRFGGTIYRLRK